MEKVNNDVGRSSPVKRAGSPVASPPSAKKGRKSRDAIKKPTEITALPMEMMHEIFSKLDSSDLMSARAACSRWNNAISSRPFVGKFSFILQRGDTENSYDTLINSEVPWEHLEIQNCHTSQFPTWDFPVTLDTSLTSLTISGGSFTWSWLVSIILQFKSLEQLTLRKCNMETENNVSCLVTDPKRPLVLKFELTYSASSIACLERFLDDANSPFSLTSMEISVPDHIYEEKEFTGNWAAVVSERLEAVERFAELTSKQNLSYQMNNGQGCYVSSPSETKDFKVQVEGFENEPEWIEIEGVEYEGEWIEIEYY